jgi:hypothetical protein
LFVGEDQEKCIPELVLIQHSLQLLTRFNNTITIVAVDDEDNALSVLEIMPPQRSDFVLSTHVPHSELNVLVFDGLDVEAWHDLSVGAVASSCLLSFGSPTDRGNCGNDFTKFELVENGGLSSSIETHHQNSHLLLAP